jgi:hypothetical protein
MDWIKIKAEHISPAYSDYEVGLLIRYQLLVARLKRVPTEKEIALELPPKRTQMLDKKVMSLYQMSLKSVASKVLEDVKSLESVRQYEKERKREYRLKQSMSRGTVPDSPTVDKIREDKIREEREFFLKNSSLKGKKRKLTTKNKMKNNNWKYNEKQHSDGFEDEINLDTGEVTQESLKRLPRNRVAIALQKEFGELCKQNLNTTPVIDGKGYFMMIDAMKYLTEDQIKAMMDEWFGSGEPVEHLVQLTRCFSHVQINKYKATHQ